MKFDGGLNCMAVYIYVLFHYLHACLSKLSDLLVNAHFFGVFLLLLGGGG